jgi:hypothetical protein
MAAIAILNHLWLRLRSAISPRWVSEVEPCFNSFRIAIIPKLKIYAVFSFGITAYILGAIAKNLPLEFASQRQND